MIDAKQTHEHGPRRDALHVAFVLDESGSMHPLAAAVIAGFDDFLEELRADGGDTYFSMTLFDTELRQVHLATPLEHVPSLAKTVFVDRDAELLRHRVYVPDIHVDQGVGTGIAFVF